MYSQFWKDELTNTKMSNGHVIGNCPICHDERWHFYANYSTGCWDCKKCGAEGNVRTYLKDFRNMKNVEISNFLERYGINPNQEVVDEHKSKPKIFDNKIIDQCCARLTDLKLNEFSIDRGLSVEILKKYQIGINERDEFTVPIFDEQGRLRNILRKKIGGDTISIKDGEGLLFGIDDLLSGSKQVYVVEGAWSAMALKERGFGAVGTCGAGVFKDEQVRLFQGLDVFIIPDNDEPGRIGAEKITQKLNGVAEQVFIVNLSVGQKKDVRNFFNESGTIEQFNDLIQKARQNAPITSSNPNVLVLSSEINEPDILLRSGLHNQVDLGLVKSINLQPLCNIDNVQRVLEGWNAFKEAIWFDEFHQKIFTNWQVGQVREWSDAETIALTVFMQSTIGLLRLSKQTVFDAVLFHARKNKRNEPKDWMESLCWDKSPRVERFIVDCLGSVDSEYVWAGSRNFLISIVARVYQPGCKVDNMLVLEGGQGTYKSTALETLIGKKFYCDAHESVTSKDFFLILQGKLIVEIAELDSFSRAEVTRIKQVITCKSDRYRIP